MNKKLIYIIVGFLTVIVIFLTLFLLTRKPELHPLAGDGVTDDTAAVQLLADEARDNNRTLHLPAGSFLISKTIYIYTSVNCQGQFVIKNSKKEAPSIIISSSVDQQNLDPNSLSGLERSSAKITGLKDVEGATLVLQSTEILIPRKDSEPYTKNDACSITSKDGDISPSLDCTYSDLSRLSVIIKPYESPINISGLKVKLSGDGNNDSYIVKCKRSNVTFDNILIQNNSAKGSPEGGLQVIDCVNVIINNPQIYGIKGRGDKYGLSMGVCANIAINDGNIVDSVHGITGRHCKNILIKGGTYSGTISGVDCHWGNSFKVDGCTIVGEGGVTYAGSDISILNCQFEDCINIFTVRTDTPELTGTVEINNVKVTTPDDYKDVYCYRSNGTSSSDPNRNQLVPDKVLITDILANIPSNGRLFYASINPSYAPMYKGKFVFENIRTLNASGQIINKIP